MKLVIILLFVALLFSPSVSAAKKRVRIAAPRGISYSTAKLSRATNSVVVSFLNLGKIAKVTYVLSYTGSGREQGVVGTLVPTGQATDSRDLYFGTCSKGVCTPHYSIRNATLTVTTELTSGATNIKRYRIKV